MAAPRQKLEAAPLQVAGKYLFAAPLSKADVRATVIPEGFKVTVCKPQRVTRPRMTSHATQGASASQAGHADAYYGAKNHRATLRGYK